MTGFLSCSDYEECTVLSATETELNPKTQTKFNPRVNLLWKKACLIFRKFQANKYHV